MFSNQKERTKQVEIMSVKTDNTKVNEELLKRYNEAIIELKRVRLDISLTGAFRMDSPIVQGIDRIIKKSE